MEYVKNENLKTLLLDWRGNPYSNGVFQMPGSSFKPSVQRLMQWKFSANPQKEEKKNDIWQLETLSFSDIPDTTEDFIIWLGHATFIMQMNGIRMITDPVFYDISFVSREIPCPIDPASIRNVDFILLSHDHRDHCDKKSLQVVCENNPNAAIFTGLKMADLLKKWTEAIATQEAGWFQVYDSKGKEIEIIYLPAKHWSRRGLSDFNTRLWGSFLIRTPTRTIYFGADSGPGPHFRQIGELFPNIEIAILGIGAYKPAYMMKEVHTTPQEAAEAWEQLGAKTLIPMHYGTFDLSDEPLSEPYFLIQDYFSRAGRADALKMLKPGEQFLI